MAAKKRLILILGPPRVGKTTVVQKLLSLSSIRFGGFYTLAELSGDGRNRIFKLVTLDRERQNVPEPSVRFLEPSLFKGASALNLNQLESRGIEGLRVAKLKSDVVVIDELGFLQLYSSLFRVVLQDLLNSQHVLLVTGHSENSELIEKLGNREDSQIFMLTKENRSYLAETICKHIHALFG